MRIIIDTNILISGALKNRNPEVVILWVASNPDCEWIVSLEILQEYQKVLNRKKLNIDQKRRNHFLYLVQQLTTLVEVNLEVNFPRDQKDAKFLACAIASEADFLITGDHDFAEVIDLGKTKIYSVSQFLPFTQPNRE